MRAKIKKIYSYASDSDDDVYNDDSNDDDASSLLSPVFARDEHALLLSTEHGPTLPCHSHLVGIVSSRACVGMCNHPPPSRYEAG